MAGSQTATSEWEIGSNPWNLQPPQPLDTDLDPVAAAVLAAFDIPQDGSVEGGKLPGLDINNMNALSALKLSVFEDFLRNGQYYEVYADVDGLAKRFDIGATSANLAVRYSVPTRRINYPVDQTKVVGFDPPPYLYVGDTYQIIPDTEGNFEAEQIAPIHLLVSKTCYELVFDRYAYYCYRAPNYASKFNDSIDSLFEENYDETVIAWVHNLEGVDNIGDRGSVNFSEYTYYPLSLKDQFGDFNIELFPINIEFTSEEEANCWIAPEESRISKIIDLSRYKYNDPDYGGQAISDVEDLEYFILTGYKITFGTSWPARTRSGRILEEGYNIYVERKDTKEAVALQEGVDFTYWFDGDELIISAGYAQKYDWEEFGYRIYWTDWDYYAGYTGEYGFVWPRLGGTGLDSGGLGSAMWVDDIFIVLRRKLNSVTIFDPEGTADFTMDNVIYEVTPIVQRDPRPATCGAARTGYEYGFNGCVDWTTTIFDTDPLTIQDLYKTSDLAKLNDALAKGVASVSIDAPYLYSENEVYTAAQTILTMFDENEIEEKVLVCSPTTEASLGESYDDAVINSISYSYNDQSAYTISITVGPMYMRDLPSAGTNVWMMETETIKRRGTVTQSAGDGLYYVVSVEGLGEFIAVNTVVGVASPEIGDVVDIEINNVPMGWA